MRGAATTYPMAGAFYRLAHMAWGDPALPVVLCVHGLTRTGRDFDALAEALSDAFHVVCPDLPGRGASDWWPDPALYQPANYVAPLTHLLARIGRPVCWVGTSLGGIVGMMVAAMDGAPVTKLVLNDIGSRIPAAALQRIGDYLGAEATPRSFRDPQAVGTYLRAVHAPFGTLTEAQWEHLTVTSCRTAPDGRWMLHYDPGIAAPYRGQVFADADLSVFWDPIDLPRLVVRGASSDLLLPETFDAMLAGGAEGYVVQDAGHAPALMDPPTIERIKSFLQAANGSPTSFSGSHGTQQRLNLARRMGRQCP